MEPSVPSAPIALTHGARAGILKGPPAPASRSVPLPEFLTELFEHGRVHVMRPAADWEEAELQRADAILAAREEHIRREFPGEAPAWRPAAARWAAVMFYRACQLTMHRELLVEALLAARAPFAEPAAREKCLPETHYSVDLAFAFLPDLLRLVRHQSRQDPLVERVVQWARDWPLSSVGMKEIVPQRVEVLFAHAGLLRCYVDRVIARGDTGRLDPPPVRAAVRQALGMYGTLAPEIAQACLAAETRSPS